MNINEEQILIQEVKDIVQGEKYDNKVAGEEELKEAIREEVFIQGRKFKLSINEKKDLVDKIYEDMKKIDILSHLMKDDSISKIMINKFNEIFVQKNSEIIRVKIGFRSEAALENLAKKIIKENNFENDKVIEGKLKGGEYITIIMPPISLTGPVITIKKCKGKKNSINDYISEEGLRILKKAIEDKRNIFISGKCKKAKTILLNELINYIPNNERIVILKRELGLDTDRVCNVMRFKYEKECSKESAVKLVNAAMKMECDRIIADEVNKDEVSSIIEGINNEYSTVIASVDANSIYDMLSKIGYMILAEGNYSKEVVKKDISSAIDIIINLGRTKEKAVHVTEIVEVHGYEDGKFKIDNIY